MLNYIAEKNKGSIEDVSINFENITVTIGDKTKTYENLSFILGRPIIDNQILMNDFGLNEWQSLHHDGDMFVSERDAAIAFGLMYNPISIEQNLEYGANIYLKNGGYTFNQVVIGNIDSLATPFQKRFGIDPLKPRAYLGERVATIHTHGAYVSRYNSDEFSTGDKNTASNRGVNSWLVTPYGHLKSFSPSAERGKQITIFHSRMPHDPLHPSRSHN
jgi:hypothetical protein